MTTISGASQYLNAATLANTQGLAAQAPTLLSQTSDATSILDNARGIFGRNGVGLSSSARQLNNSFIAQTGGLANSLLSLAAGVDSDVDGARQQILALRAKLPASAISRAVTGEGVDVEA